MTPEEIIQAYNKVFMDGHIVYSKSSLEDFFHELRINAIINSNNYAVNIIVLQYVEDWAKNIIDGLLRYIKPTGSCLHILIYQIDVTDELIQKLKKEQV